MNSNQKTKFSLEERTDLGRSIWRLDPEESFSDWKVEIVSDEEVQTYHVHKNYLAVGDRKSGYFARLFRNAGNFKESEDCTSRIELDPLAAASFPALLDYVYAYDEPLEVNTKTATALHYLGDYFEITPLRRDAEQFIHSDVTTSKACTYYKHATGFQDETIVNMVAECLGANVCDISLNHPLIVNADPELWVQASKFVPEGGQIAKKWSELVAALARIHIDSLESQTFQTLVRPAKMEQVDSKVALELLELEERFDGNKPSELTFLQERCAFALAEDFNDFVGKLNDQEFLSSLRSRNSGFLVELLMKSMHKTHEILQDNIALRNQSLYYDTLGKAEQIIRRFQPLPQRAQLERNTSATAVMPPEIKVLIPGIRTIVGQTYTVQNGFYRRSCPVFYYDVTKA